LSNINGHAALLAIRCCYSIPAAATTTLIVVVIISNTISITITIIITIIITTFRVIATATAACHLADTSHTVSPESLDDYGQRRRGWGGVANRHRAF
jgi:hypothetical protein